MNKKRKNNEVSFEEAFRKLEKTVQAMEKGNLTLEESTKLYEEGVTLASWCNELLSKAELKITELNTSIGTEMTDTDNPEE